ncbi:MAG: tRNA pseudouridine(38-40) synthase TruA [Synergistaceae bacterium]|nr:tRNA pseudouridine(38-40) synthase TruA [Synergistaceae bacterium]MBQ3448952.1 tRNA pseudouridine(38-40) synthase TruA [Synergistaceae bacterium]MBQ3693852.1 tRNA pseudouridine(38-40) synthase TruA [Synergistaceae bacterium]MBQ6110775.1 tRNA pseudouridine(38-40) synthase TruA [Synergistaceae bacterium]MBQ9629328.1 tRNA pseudouridine(38-40) synthase TruA [Synergistaceae bacterium]
MRYAAKISYLGKNYSGWQVQPDAISIQEVIEGALGKISGAPVRITGAGRTDKGVNAYGQIASFDLAKEFTPEKLRLAINFYLPDDIRIMKIFHVPDDFNARYSAISREYKYFIWNDYVCPPFLNNFVWWRKGREWDMTLAHKACEMIQGRHNFRAFCRAGECPDDPFRTIDSLKIRKRGRLSVISIKAQSFLTNMVRIITGNINEIASGKRKLEWLEGLLSGGERIDSAMNTPACGLWFWKVIYDMRI